MEKSGVIFFFVLFVCMKERHTQANRQMSALLGNYRYEKGKKLRVSGEKEKERLKRDRGNKRKSERERETDR